MSGNTMRLDAISSIAANGSAYSDFDYTESPSGELFGQNVFTLEVMEERLSKAAFKAVKKMIQGTEPFDAAVADEVASAMKAWAMERGATHFAHVFYPLTGRMANKHDSFFSPTGSGSVVSELSGSSLLQQEPDGSSFPGGDLRSTHEARSYTAWDITSPAYLLDNPNGITLCVPTAFVSWKGDSLGMKTPLLRAQAAMGKQAERILKIFGHTDIAPVTASSGPEQEYFLVDKAFYTARPDLLNAGRTLFGAPSPKGQQFDDHYFGIIHERVQAFMFDFEREAYKLGIPVTTRHNEVAPGQYEVAPVYSSANVAADQQQLIMHLLQSISEHHGFACLLHPKPFAGVNGSGKHLNFSIGNSTQGNLFDPTSTPHSNMQFLVFCAALIRSVYLHGDLLRASIAAAANDHRLGANEAPPAIMSIFLGTQLANVMEQIRSGDELFSIQSGDIDLGVSSLALLPRDSGDRNRTSPLAFTGNKFEFRAVGSSSSISPASIVINTILAESFEFIADELAGVKGGKKGLLTAAQALIKSILDECHTVLFEGDGYADAWHQEAEKRGLPNLRTTADALPVYGNAEVVALFGKYGVLSADELQARKDVAIEQYVMTVEMEAKLTQEIAQTMIYPAAVRYQSELAGAAANMKAAGLDPEMDTLKEVSGLIKELGAGVKELVKLMAGVPHGDLEAEAHYSADKILPQMLVVREAADALEGLVADDLWPLPTYQEMLFIR